MIDFRKLQIWEIGHEIALLIYKETKKFPKNELFGLTGQIRRSSISVPSNIAEGCGRGSDPDFLRFLNIAMGSASELEYQILLSKDLGYINDLTYEEISQLLIKMKKMLNSFIEKVKIRIKNK
jgi:four helix bundle protein